MLCKDYNSDVLNYAYSNVSNIQECVRRSSAFHESKGIGCCNMTGSNSDCSQLCHCNVTSQKCVRKSSAFHEYKGISCCSKTDLNSVCSQLCYSNEVTSKNV